MEPPFVWPRKNVDSLMAFWEALVERLNFGARTIFFFFLRVGPRELLICLACLRSKTNIWHLSGSKTVTAPSSSPTFYLRCVSTSTNRSGRRARDLPYISSRPSALWTYQVRDERRSDARHVYLLTPKKSTSACDKTALSPPRAVVTSCPPARPPASVCVT